MMKRLGVLFLVSWPSQRLMVHLSSPRLFVAVRRICPFSLSSISTWWVFSCSHFLFVSHSVEFIGGHGLRRFFSSIHAQ